MNIATIVALYRLANPRSRVIGLFRFEKNGANGPRSMACIVCGEVGPSWCGKWPKTVRAERWEHEHAKKHEEQFEMQAGVL